MSDKVKAPYCTGVNWFCLSKSCMWITAQGAAQAEAGACRTKGLLNTPHTAPHAPVPDILFDSTGSSKVPYTKASNLSDCSPGDSGKMQLFRNQLAV